MSILKNYRLKGRLGQDSSCTPFQVIWIEARPFGLADTPATSSLALDFTLLGIKLKAFLVYLDNFILRSSFVGEHFLWVAGNLRILACENVLLKWGKWEFLCNTLTYLGQVVKSRMLVFEAGTIELLKGPFILRTKRGLQSFFDLCSHHRRLFHDFAHTAVPPNEVLC